MSSDKDETFRFSSLDTVGAADAENDSYLSDCFVNTGIIEPILDCGDPRRILLGRTGSGKTAIIKRICSQEDRASELNPEKLALSYISNSNILNFVTNIGAHLDLFFKLLWRHVLTVEILQKRYELDSEDALTRFFDKILRSAKSRSKERAFRYLQEWGPSFWEKSDYRIKEISQKLERKLEGAIGSDFIKAGGAANFTHEKKTELSQRAQSIINQVQVKELTEILDVIDDVLDDSQKRYYIAIDRLDEGWADDTIRYRMIRALIESTRDFRKVRNAKIIIAMREDLLRKVLEETQEAGFQREKYESLLLNIRWNRSAMEEVIDRRIRVLVSRQYTKQPVGIRDLVPGRSQNKEDSISYIIDRTLMRPRDAILFVNEIIRASDGKNTLTKRSITGAESEYSRRRIESVVDEWSSLWPSIRYIIKLLPRGDNVFGVNTIGKDFCEKLWESIFTVYSNRDILPSDKVSNFLDGFSSGNRSWQDVTLCLIRMLYDTGICGIRIGKSKPVYSYNQPLPTMTEIDLSSIRMVYDKTFWAYFDVRVLRRVPNGSCLAFRLQNR